MRQSFAYIHLNGKRLLFLSIQFHVSQFFQHCLNGQAVLTDTSIGPYQVLPLQIRMDLRAMAIKVYFTFFKPQKRETHH